ncbi:MAG: hypothetical protein IKQ10_09200 [Oscillospiraceae bacterium]|nr:hypothetical protein [Oscillospiraceae bacterium]
MKRPFSFAVAYLCLLSLLTLGVYELAFTDRGERLSQSENRILQPFPALSVSSVLSGRFMEEFDGFLSDAFPRRDDMVRFSKSALALFGGESEEDENAAAKAALEAEEIAVEEPAPTAEVPAETAAEPAETAAPAEAAVPAAAPSAAPGTESGAEPEALAGDGEGPDTEIITEAGEGGASLWLIGLDGAVEVQEAYPAANLRTVADMLELYRDALPADGEIHFINAPVSYMWKSLHYGRKLGWGCDLDEVLQDMVGERIYIYDVTEILDESTYNKPVYSMVGDHHWFPMGACMTVAAMARTQGLVPTDYYEYLYHTHYDFKGKPYTKEQLEAIDVEAAARNCQTVIPVTPVDSYIVKRLTELSPSVYMEDNRFVQYGIYLGGRRGPYRLFVTGYHTGRNALVIGDSFYHAFVPYLTPFYDNILCTDPRDEMYNYNTVGPNISTYIREYGIDDIYFVTCTYTSVNGYVFQDRLARHLYEDRR